MKNIMVNIKESKNGWLGIVLVFVIALLSKELAQIKFFQQFGLGALSCAIIIGIMIGNTIFSKIASHTERGVDYTKNTLLRLGIILYGFQITFQQIIDMRWFAIMLAVSMIILTYVFTVQIGTKVLKLDKEIVRLIAAGSSICGAAAIMATEPIIRAQAHKVSIAVATVVVFGTLSMFAYPLLLPLFHSDQIYGIFTGATIHEVAQVVVAGKNVSETAAAAAIIEKMIRVMMLAPFLFVLSFSLKTTQKEHHQTAQITIPWFAILFVVVSGLNSLHIIPPKIVHVILQIDTIILSMAMAALGLRTHIYAIKQAGLKPLVLGGITWFFLMIVGFFLCYFIF
ncbi:YeiH family protein [Neisseria sp. Ec49-e6-T10]|uniref:YeiH family protein n=1 Tax=Neisseria sp. Ec49-e6-T10 TaxID=3140744 RepID=UPI003EBD2746